MKIKTNGVTRIVFLIGNYAVKIPNITCEHGHFLQGCYANWSERKYSKWFKYCTDSDYGKKIAPTIFSTWFGLLSIQQRVTELTRDLTHEEEEYFKDQTTDIKPQNFGYLNGKLVCIDYV